MHEPKNVGPLKNKSSRKQISLLKSKFNYSHVWGYFGRVNDETKCLICGKHTNGVKWNNTRPLIRHLVIVHGLAETDFIGKALNSISKLRQIPRAKFMEKPREKRSHMRKRILENFDEMPGGTYRCQKCDYTCDTLSLYLMFIHLTDTHWKGTVQLSGKVFPVRSEGICETPSVQSKTEQMIENHVVTGGNQLQLVTSTDNVSENNKQESETQTVGNLEGRVNPSGSNSRNGISFNKLTMNSNSLLKNGNRKTTSDNVPGNHMRIKNPVNGQDSYLNFDTRDVFPIVQIERCSMNLQQTVAEIKQEFNIDFSELQAPINDDENGSDHPYWKESGKKPAMVSSETVKVSGLSTNREQRISDPRTDTGINKLEDSISNFQAPIEDVQKELNRRCSKKSGTERAVVPPKETKVAKLLTNQQKHGHNSRIDIEIIKLEDSDDSDTEMPQIPLQNESRSDVEKIKLEQPDPLEIDIQVPLQDVTDFKTHSERHKDGQTPISYECIKTEKVGEKHNVAVITLNRPKALNALCQKLVDEVNDAVTKFDRDNSIGAIIITGSEKAFAAGTDIKEMQNHTYAQAIRKMSHISWNGISQASKPVIAAVNGYALGGGCELALTCDIIYAGEEACFGQPEIVMGTIPGAGGTQRLARALGKSKAMEIMLTGNQISALEAEKSGLVSKIFPPEQLLSKAIKLGERISTHSRLIASMAKEAVNSAYETTLQEGLHLEKQLYCGTLATADRTEGMAAFAEKRTPHFKNE